MSELITVVTIPPQQAQRVLDLMGPELTRHHKRGTLTPADRKLITDLSRLARVHRDGVPHGSNSGAADCRSPILDYVTSQTAAQALNITERAVRQRAANGSLHAEKGPDGAWRIDAGELP